MKYYTYDKPTHLCPVGCCPSEDCENEGFPIMFDPSDEQKATCHGIGSSHNQAQEVCDKLNADLELRRVTIYEPPQYDYTDAELHQGDEDNQEEMEEMEEGEL
jgi:hypothetical protein